MIIQTHKTHNRMAKNQPLTIYNAVKPPRSTIKQVIA